MQPTFLGKYELSVLSLGLESRYEIGTGSEASDNAVGDSLIVKAEVAVRFFKGRVENGVLNCAHRHLPPVVMSALRQRVVADGMIRAQTRNRKAGGAGDGGPTWDWDGEVGSVWSGWVARGGLRKE